MNEELQNKILVIAACDILSQCNDSRYYVVHFNTDLENNLHLDAPYDRKYFHSIKDTFHNILQISDFSSIGEVEHFYSHNIHILKGLYGILLFLYSVIMTKVKTSSQLVSFFVILCLFEGSGTGQARVW